MALDVSTEEGRRAVIARCVRMGTGVWSDALDKVGIPGVLSNLTMRSGSGRCAGFALTVRGETGTLDQFSLEEFGQGEMLLAAGPTDVLVIDAGGAEISSLGGISALNARKRGIEAVVIDGACRDVDDIRKCGLWVASRHVTPRSGKRRSRLGHLGEPITLSGVTVRSGDLVIGDSDGVTVISQDHLEAVLAAAEGVNLADAKLENDVAAGHSLRDALADAAKS